MNLQSQKSFPFLALVQCCTSAWPICLCCGPDTICETSVSPLPLLGLPCRFTRGNFLLSCGHCGILQRMLLSECVCLGWGRGVILDCSSLCVAFCNAYYNTYAGEVWVVWVVVEMRSWPQVVSTWDITFGR